MNGTSSITPDCVGPIPLPPGLMGTVRCLAATAGTSDFAALSICAGALVERLLRPGTNCLASVIHGADEAVVPVGALDLSTGFRTALRAAAQSRSAPTADAGCPVAVTILVSPDGRDLYVESMTDAPDVPSAQSWARSYRQLLTCLANEPDAPMRSHPLVGDDERDRILHRLNPYNIPKIPYRTMAEPFEEQVERRPDAVALLDEHGETVTYRDLNERSNRLAHHLRERGAGPGTRVGICLERGINQVVAIYAAVKAGAIYVPIDAALPDERIAFLLDDSAPGHVLTDSACRGRVPDGPWQICDVHEGSGQPATNPVVERDPDALVHILYTSGTTGRPKGVATLVAAALANNIWMQRQYPYGPGDTALFKTSPGFDVSIWELFWPLYHGARLMICRPGAERDPRHLARLTEAHGVSFIFVVPTMMTPFLEELSPARTGALRWVLCGGEPMSPRIRDAFYAKLPASRLINAFGPTEAGPVTDNVVDPDSGGVFVPVGRPADNFRVTLLNAQLELVPIGSPGEAYISGPVGLAEGYWRAPARTAERFVADPYGPPGSRMYRTGDLCRYREDGLLEHLGRIDRQIKIRGLRVEPGEIEAVLAGHPAVGDCAVLAHGQPPRLIAFVVPAGQPPGTGVDLTSVLEQAAAPLPVHMRPERLVPVERLPATVNGKIDQAELIGIWLATAERERVVVPPADELEATLVDIYHRVLNTSPISMLDTFVQLGGHSLLAFRLVDECRTTLRFTPDVARLPTTTLRDVAASIRRMSDAHEPSQPAEVGIGHPDDQRHRQAG